MMPASSTTATVVEYHDPSQAIELELVEAPLAPPKTNILHGRFSVDKGRLENSPEHLTNSVLPLLSKWRASIIIGTVSGVSLINCMLIGILIVSLPTMGRELGLPDALLLWPASVSSLTCGCTLLLSGLVSDVIGGRKIYLIGTFLLILTTIACGVCQTGLQLILFRAAQGLALSLCLPSSVILITSNFPTGSYRNVAFACLGAGQPVGFSIGLVLGGIFVQNFGCRWGYYIGAMLTFVIFIISIFGIPVDQEIQTQSFRTIFRRLGSEIDWIGCALISTSLGLFSYVLSVLAGSTSSFIAPAPITLSAIAVLLVPVFMWHTRRQERLGRKVIIPPSLWSNTVFNSLCIAVFLIWGTFNAIQYFLAVFYQLVQTLSAIQTSIRFLPMVVTSIVANVLTGWLVKHVRADALVLSSAIITAISPLLMAIINPGWSYWVCALVATACAPICADVLFTVANLVITTIFPPQAHGLAGGVFNTIANIGNSVGLAVTAVVASTVTMAGKGDPIEILMDGYRATFWLCFSGNIIALFVVGLGLRKIGKVGIKMD